MLVNNARNKEIGFLFGNERISSDGPASAQKSGRTVFVAPLDTQVKWPRYKNFDKVIIRKSDQFTLIADDFF